MNRLSAALLASLFALPAWADSAEADATELTPVVVTATRTAESLATLANTVTIIERDALNLQHLSAVSLSEILGKLVPGLAVASGTQTNYNQTLRGRAMLVLIDGIPQNTVRAVSRDLFTIDPSVIERIEVIHGATALYGHGGAGGVVNIITRRPDAGSEQTSELGLRSSLTHLGNEALGGSVRQSMISGLGDVRLVLSAGVDYVGGGYDADGNRIAPEPAQGDFADSTIPTLFAKVGWEGTGQRVDLGVNLFHARQDTDYASDPAVNSQPAGSVPSVAIRGLQLEEQPESDNDLLNLSYGLDQLFGSRLQSQVYYRDYYTRFFPFDGRTVYTQPGRSVVQSYLTSRAWGSRLAIETPLAPTRGVDLVWGVDYGDENTEQRVTVFDRAAYDASGGLRYQAIEELGWVPSIDHGQVGLFAQLEWEVADRITVRGGARHERIDVTVEDYVNLDRGDVIRGGDIRYADTAYNLGAAYRLHEGAQLFANYAEGFSLPDVGLILRNAPAGFTVSSTTLQPLAVQNHELGVRGHWSAGSASFSVFYAESDLGFFSNGLNDPVQRAPERTYGAEAALQVQLSSATAAGGTLTFVEGQYEDATTGDKVALNGWRIPPPKATAYLAQQLFGWEGRLQALYSGARDEAFEDLPAGFGRGAVEDYVVLDLVGSKRVGAAVVSAGIENLLNEDYYNVFSQLLYSGNVSHFKAPGRTLRLGLRFTW